MTYGGISEDKTQDVSLDSIVVFQTAAGSVDPGPEKEVPPEENI
jgi:hypothetical protein